MEYLRAVRPLTLCCSVIPVFVAAAVCGIESFYHRNFSRVLGAMICVHAGANLVNIHCDFKRGVDNAALAEKNNNHTVLTQGTLSSPQILLLACLFYCAAGGLLYEPCIELTAVAREELVSTLILGMLLSFFYSADPIGIKYRGLGDVTIYLCFGPLLMQAVSVLLTGISQSSMTYYSIPTGIMNVAIIHARNSRDINDDSKARITTFAMLLGYQKSYTWYTFLITTAYIASCVIGIFCSFGVWLIVLTAPFGSSLISSFQKGQLKHLQMKTMRAYVILGFVYVLGILLSKNVNTFEFVERIDLANYMG